MFKCASVNLFEASVYFTGPSCVWTQVVFGQGGMAASASVKRYGDPVTKRFSDTWIQLDSVTRGSNDKLEIPNLQRSSFSKSLTGTTYSVQPASDPTQVLLPSPPRLPPPAPRPRSPLPSPCNSPNSWNTTRNTELL